MAGKAKIHIKNLEKYHPGYKDRELIWCKTYFKMINADPEFEMLCEIDRWRFVALVMLELQVKKPIPIDNEYLRRKGFDLKKRPIRLTIESLHKLIEVFCDNAAQPTDITNVTEHNQGALQNVTDSPENVTQSRVEESREEKKRYRDFILLTSEEHKKLLQRYGENNTRKLIDSLNRYIGSTGKKYNSHYFTLLNFAKRDEMPELKTPKQKQASEQQAREKYKQKMRDEHGEYYRGLSPEKLKEHYEAKNLIHHRWLIEEILKGRK